MDGIELGCISSSADTRIITEVSGSSEITLYDYLLEDKYLSYLLYCTLLNYRSFGSNHQVSLITKWVTYLMMSLIPLSVIFYCFLGIYLSADYFGPFYMRTSLAWLFGLLALTLILTAILSVVVTAQIYWRSLALLQQPLRSNDIPHFRPAVTIGLILLTTTLVTFFISYYLTFGVRASQSVVPSTIYQWFVTNGLILSMFFVIVDTRVCNSLLDGLISLSEMDRLNMNKYLEVCDEIKRRVNDSTTVINYTVVVACLNALYFVVVTTVLRIQVSTPSLTAKPISLSNRVEFYIGTTLMDASVALKEVVYLIIVLFEISGVNDKADKLMSTFYSRIWIEDDHRRLQLFVHYYGQPISYNVLGFRLSRTQLYAQIVGYVVTIFIAALQTAFNPELQTVQNAYKRL